MWVENSDVELSKRRMARTIHIVGPGPTHALNAFVTRCHDESRSGRQNSRR